MNKYCLFFMCFLLVSGLNTQSQYSEQKTGWGKIGYKLTTGVVGAIKDNVRPIQISGDDIDTLAYHAGHGFVHGAILGIKQENLHIDIKNAVDSLSKIAAQNLVKMRDSLLRMNDTTVGFYLLQWAGNLREQLLGEGLDLDVRRLLSTILSQDTELRTRRLVRGVIDECLSLPPETQKKLNLMMDLVGTATGRQVGKITDTIFQHFNAGLRAEGKKIDAIVKPYLIGLEIIGGLLLLASGLLAITLSNRNKYRKLSDVLTYEIHKSPPEYFDDLAGRIRDQAKKEGVEKFLRERLDAKGLLGDKTRGPITAK